VPPAEQAARAEAEGERARLQQAVDKYRAESDRLRAKAQGLEGQ
jgi:hypothetical protein